MVHIVRVPPSPSDLRNERSQLDHDKRTILRTTAISGGLSYFPKDPAEMEASLEHLSAAMKTVYTLTYSTGAPAPDGRERQIDIKLDKAHGGSKSAMRAPEGYYAPSQ